MNPARSVFRNFFPAALANAVEAAPEIPRAASLPVRTARLLMALPPELRNTLSVVHQQLESTERRLTELTTPTGTLEAIKAKQERLGHDLQKLADARAELAATRRYDEADHIDAPLALMTECLNRLGYECEIRMAGDTLLNHYRDLGTLLQTAKMSYAQGQQRINPIAPGGAPNPQQSLPGLGNEEITALNVHLDHALAATSQGELLSHLATLTFGLNRSSPHHDVYFFGWFAARAVLESRQLSAPDLLDGTVFRDMQREFLSTEQIQHRLAETTLLLADNQSMFRFAQLAVAAPPAAFPAAPAIQNCLNTPQLLAVRNPPTPRADARDDAAWDLIKTPPASPRT